MLDLRPRRSWRILGQETSTSPMTPYAYPSSAMVIRIENSWEHLTTIHTFPQRDLINVAHTRGIGHRSWIKISWMVLVVRELKAQVRV